MRGGIFSAFFLIFVAAAAHAPVWAQPPRAPDGVQPLDRLLPQIRRHHPGDFYDAEGPTYGPNGDPHYHLKWMTPDGRVIWLDADARNGRVLRSSPGRDSFDGRRQNPRDQDFRGGPPQYQQFGQPGARDPYEDRYRSRFGGDFRGRDNGEGDRYGPRRGGPRAGDFGRRR